MKSRHAANPTRSTAPSAFPGTAMANLAQRVRDAGLCLIFVAAPHEAPENSGPKQVIFHDPLAGPYFEKLILPLLRNPSPQLAEQIQGIHAASPAVVWQCDCGALLAAVPCVERRQLAGVFILAAKRGDFIPDDDFNQQCAALGVEAQWLAQQADLIPGHSPASLQRQAELLLAMVRDQFQLANLRGELNSLSNQLANTYEELSLIYQVSSGMRVNRRAGDFFKQACLELMEVMGVNGMGIVLCGEHSARHAPVVYGRLTLPNGTIDRMAEELMPRVTERDTPLLINDLRKETGFNWLSPYVRRILAVPMQRQDQILGCYFAIDKLEGDFDSQDSKLLSSIANESAIYLENAMLFDDVHGLMMGLLHSLTSAVDAKDTYTLGHSERVAAFARQLTLEAGFDEALAERVYLAGLLHDVGKIGVPESVLQKTGRLTPEEFDQMKKHPEIGARILADVKQIRDLIPGVLHHHERYDGNGYPHGLAGEKIPMMGRLICLADCFDAMTSNRTYRKALPLEVAMTEIRRCGGTQFDPKLTEAFLRIGVDRLRELVISPRKLDGLATQGLITTGTVPLLPQAAA